MCIENINSRLYSALCFKINKIIKSYFRSGWVHEAQDDILTHEKTLEICVEIWVFEFDSPD